MELAHSENVCLPLFFYLAVNKLITNKTPNIFCSIAEHSAFIEYNTIELFKSMGYFFQATQRKMSWNNPIWKKIMECSCNLQPEVSEKDEAKISE